MVTWLQDAGLIRFGLRLSPLGLAAREGKTEAVQLLLEAEWRAEVKD